MVTISLGTTGCGYASAFTISLLQALLLAPPFLAFVGASTLGIAQFYRGVRRLQREEIEASVKMLLIAAVSSSILLISIGALQIVSTRSVF